jgi:hypothetical protein
MHPPCAERLAMSQIVDANDARQLARGQDRRGGLQIVR